MPQRLNFTVAAAVALALCAGLFAHAQNQQKKPGTEKTPTPKTAPAKPAPAKPATTPPGKKPPVEKAAVADKPRAGDGTVEQEIRASAKDFATLYNEHNAKALASLFAEQAEMVDEGGKLVKGRDPIEAEFQRQFEEHPACTMRVEIESIRVLTPHLALEEGIALCAAAPGEPEDVTRYVCVHVKLNENWLMASVSDTAATPGNLTPHDHLQELTWLIGDWIDESFAANVRSICDWDESGNFLLSHFQVQIAGQTTMTGTTRIGWDAVAKQFRSWVFDSEGGFSEGVWFAHGDEWIVKTHGATAEGATCSSTNVYRRVNQDTLTFRSHDRIVNGQLTPEIEELVIKRRAPAPEE